MNKLEQATFNLSYWILDGTDSIHCELKDLTDEIFHSTVANTLSDYCCNKEMARDLDVLKAAIDDNKWADRRSLEKYTRRIVNKYSKYD